MNKFRRILKAAWAFLGTTWVKTIILVLLLVVLSVGAWFLWPRLYHYLNPQNFDNRMAIVIGIVQGLGVIFIAAGLYFTYKNWQTSREGQITDRFTRAIQQLGDPKLEVRLGGIYALERIARDSPRDHWTIMEVLTAYVRENAPWKEDAKPSPHVKLRTDIQAILTVIGRRPEKARKDERKNHHTLDLCATDLREAALVGVHLEGVGLLGSHLEVAGFIGANLQGAGLANAHLQGAIFLDTNLEGAILVGVHLQMANLVKGHMKNADLRFAHLEGANLTGATGLTREQLATAITDEHTVLPYYLKDPGGKESPSPKSEDGQLKPGT